MATPTRDTSERELDKWNIAMRQSPGYQNFLRQQGIPVGGGVKLSRDQQSALEATLKRAGIPIPSGMHIDQGGNLNQKNRTVRNVAIAAGITAATIATAGAAGFGPLAGVMGGAGGAGGAGAGAAAATGGGTAAGAGGATAAGVGGTAAAGGGAAAAGGIGGTAATTAGAGGAVSMMDKIRGGMDIAQRVGSVMGANQQGQAQGAIQEALAQQAQDRNALSRYQAEQQAQMQSGQLDLDRQKFGAGEQGRNAKNAIMSALLGNMQRSNVSVPGITNAKVSGGLFDTLRNNPQALESLSTLQKQASTGLNAPSKFTGGEMVKPPDLTALPDVGGSGGFMKLLQQGLQFGGAGSGLLDLIKKQRGPAMPPPVATPPPTTGYRAPSYRPPDDELEMSR